MPGSDDAALRALHDAHAPALRRYISHLQGDPISAEDTVQETLLRAWRTPKILAQEPSEARAWLFTVARHLVIDEARSARHRHELTVDTLPERAVEQRTDLLFDAILIEEALATLGIDHRRAVIRIYFGGLTVPELAEELGIPEGTAKSRLHYGLRALRLALQEKGVTR